MLRPVLFGCFLGSILNLCQCISFAHTFANTWAVKIHGGDAVLKRVARKHGFVNESKVSELCVTLTLECTEPLFEKLIRKQCYCKRNKRTSNCEQKESAFR